MIQLSTANTNTLSGQDFQRIYDLLIHAYAVTEIEIWGENYVRISQEEYRDLITDGKIYLAKIDGIIVGSIYAYPLDNKTYSFGLLNADFDLKGKGIGRALIAHAEEIAKAHGASHMQLEILRPRDQEVPIKEELKAWYERLGYVLVNSASFIELKPDKIEKAKELITPSIFEVFTKKL